ncbi:E3 ubiquitin-protein ligase complex slx8-rfp subunit slx8-like [Macadamia integrifolia]|uniref:E3 ubiquitin-protein ligase complex slx8-rfp subunit slx8-like n=1 Tax=Macadamia integrifolia TaxID=60698 RepID=UPI001C4ED9FF|nr:E3 ubiquitin-protein ligase complex slx8-rfp subunit slx8-like [Macadamia integrifolia]
MSSNSQGQTSFLGSQGSYKLQREEDFELLLESTALNQNGILNQDQTVPFKNQNTDAMPEVHAGRDVAPEYMRLGGESSNRELEVEIEEIKLMCVICLGEMEEETSTLCGHIFCKDCIMSAIWMKRRCPVCLTPLSIGSIHRIFLPTGDCHSLI